MGNEATASVSWSNLEIVMFLFAHLLFVRLGNEKRILAD